MKAGNDTIAELRERSVWFGEHKGIRFEINRFAGFEHNGQKYGWTFYLHLLKEQFPLEDQEKVLPKAYFSQFGSMHETYNGPLEELNWHGGLTWSSNEKRPGTPFTALKFGCDFQHLWDNNREYCLNGVLAEVHSCIDSLLTKWPKLKTGNELWDEFREKFPGEAAGDTRFFDINGNAIEYPYGEL